MDVGERIKRLRIRQGMTQLELAAKTGYKNASTIAKIESGDRDVPKFKLEMIAEALGTTVDYLQNGDHIDPQWGNDEKNQDYLKKKNPDAYDVYMKITRNPQLTVLFDKSKDLSPEDVEILIGLIDRMNH